MDNITRKALRKVITYLWKDEQNDFWTWNDDPIGQKHHIFNALKTLKASLKHSAWLMNYSELQRHDGHKLELFEVYQWQTNRPYLIEIRCTETECQSEEPILEIDTPK
jgi:hypothetical protein